jgi:uncharacterized SAM-binding protein YcdF (DUF218 family)
MNGALPLPQRTRTLRALAWTVASGGALLWRTLRVVLAVARGAPTGVPSATRWLLVPGFRLAEGDVRRHFAQRIERAHALWQAGPERGLVLSGAPARADARSEAAAALEHLADLGLPAQVPVVLDHAARTTLQNLLHCRARLGDACGHVAVVSNRYHVARIAWLLQALGLDWSVAAAEPAWRSTPLALAAALREAAALLALAGPAAARLDAATLLRTPLDPPL